MRYQVSSSPISDERPEAQPLDLLEVWGELSGWIERLYDAFERIIPGWILMTAQRVDGGVADPAEHQYSHRDGSWRIVAIGDEPIPGDVLPIVRFLPGGSVQLTLACGTGMSEVGMDTDGHWLVFVGFAFDSPDCPDTGNDERVLAALMGVESWDVVADRTIEFRGATTVRLERADDGGGGTP